MAKYKFQILKSNIPYDIEIDQNILILPGDFPWPSHLPSLPLSGDEHILNYKIDFQNDTNLQQKATIKKFFQDSCQFSSDNDKQQFMSDFDQIFQPEIYDLNRKHLGRGILFAIATIALLATSIFLLIRAVDINSYSLVLFFEKLLPLIFTAFASSCCFGFSIMFLLKFNPSISTSNNAVNHSVAFIANDTIEITTETETENYELHLFNYQTSSKKAPLPTESEIKNQLQEAENVENLAEKKTDTNQSNFNSTEG